MKTETIFIMGQPLSTNGGDMRAAADGLTNAKPAITAAPHHRMVRQIYSTIRSFQRLPA